MSWITDYLSSTVFPSTFHITYIIEILFYAFLIYVVFRWLKDTRAYTLLRGIVVIFIFVALANILRLTTVTWAIYKISPVVLTVLAIIFQPELRRSLQEPLRSRCRCLRLLHGQERSERTAPCHLSQSPGSPASSRFQLPAWKHDPHRR